MKKKLNKQEIADHKAQIDDWNLDCEVLEAELVDIRGQLNHIGLALKAKIAALRVELVSIQLDLEKNLTKRQLQKALKTKTAKLERTKLNIKALKYQIKEGIDMPDKEETSEEPEETKDSEEDKEEESSEESDEDEDSDDN